MNRAWPFLASTTLHGAMIAVAVVVATATPARFSVQGGGGGTVALRLGEPRGLDTPAPAEPRAGDATVHIEEAPELPAFDIYSQAPAEPPGPVRAAVPPARFDMPARTQPLKGAATGRTDGGTTGGTAPGALADGPPGELSNPAPAYPDAARRKGHEGEVVLVFDVTADGTCADARVDKSSGHSTLDNAALTAVRAWRYTPATKGGQPVRSTQRVRFVFKLK